MANRLPTVLETPAMPAGCQVSPEAISGANVVFINMPLRETARPNTTPEGPLLMATRLRQQYGVNATIIDLNVYRIRDEEAQRCHLPNGRHLTERETRELLDAHFKAHGEPDLVAMSGMITTLKWQERVARMVRDLMPDTYLVSGGGLATELKGGLFRYIPELDAVAHSEGDDIIAQIVQDSLSSASRAKHKVYAGDRPDNLDELPSADLELLRIDVLGNPILEWYMSVPSWSAAASNSSAAPWNDEDVVPKTTSVSSRGCPHGCKYCYRGAQGERRWGVRSAEHLALEVQDHINRYGIKFHGYPDDNFAVTHKRIEEIERVFREMDIRIPWGTHTRMDEAAGFRILGDGSEQWENPTRADLMARAGCKYIGFGPESASERVLIAIGKGGHTLQNGFENVSVNGKSWRFPRSMTEAIRNCARHGIHANCTWIMGSPTETLGDLKTSVAFIAWQIEEATRNSISAEAINQRFFTMTWYPGTELSKIPKVRHELTKVFGLSFDEAGEPVCDDNFHRFLLELDDATKLLENEAGEPLNFSDMPDGLFLQVRQLVDEGRTLDILDL